MNTIWMNLDEIFMWVARASLYAVAVIAVIVLVQTLTRRVLAAKWICALWVVLLLRLAIPTGPESGLSLWNLTPRSWIQQMFSEPDSAPAISDVLVTFEQPAAGNDAALLPRGDFSASWHTLRTFLPGVWLAGALLMMCGILIGDIRLWNTVRRLPFVTDHALLALLEECRQSMRIWTVVGLVVTDRVKSPILFGFIRPRILLPADLARDLPQERLRYILLHELAHLKRRDILTGWILAFLQALHWFNPLVWWAFGRIRFDRELACDEQVLSRVPKEDRRDYGNVLVGMLERFNHIHHLPAIAGILENKDQIKRRLIMIKKFRRPARREIIAFAALLAVLSIALLTESLPLLSQSTNEQSAAAESLIAVSIGDNGEVAINGLERTWDQFETELQSIYEGRSNKNMFIYASRPEAQRDDIDRVLDVAKRAGVIGIALLTESGKPREQVNQDANSDSVSAGNLTDGLQPPEVLANTRPDYTKEARGARIEGVVVLKVVIRKDGLVDNVEVMQGLGYGLDEAAIEAVMTEWRFKPATLNGEPIEHPAIIEVSFALF